MALIRKLGHFRGHWGRATLVLFFLMFIGQNTIAAENKVLDKKSYRDPAPNLEDHAAYFNGKYGQEFNSNNEKKADILRVKTIDSIKGILADNKLDDFRKFELYLRLGELYVERHDYLRNLEIENYNQAYEKWEKEGKKGDNPILDNKNSRSYLLEATNTFRNLSNLYPKHPRLDSILFALARNLSRLGNDNAVLYYNKLLKNFPKSALVPETHLALGEHFFEKNETTEALDQYKQAIKYKNSEVYPYAIYKLGWAFFNAKYKNEGEYFENLKKTVAAFKLVVKLAQTQPKNYKNVVLLKEEAINDLIGVWAEAEDINSAWVYFKKIGSEDSFYTMLDRLARIYIDQGKNKQAVAVIERILKEAPTRLLNMENQLLLVELYNTSGDLANVEKNFKLMATNYRVDSPWGRANKAKNPDVVEDAEQKIPRSMHRYAATYHNKGLKAENSPTLKTAMNLYSIMLESFPKYPNLVEIRFNFAELNMHLKYYEIASREYVKVSRSDKRDGKWAKISAQNAITAVNKIIEKKKYDKLPPPGEATREIAIPAEKLRLIEVIDNYADLYPEEKNVPELMAVCAHIQFMHGYYAPAVVRYEALLTKKPQTKEAQDATKIVINYLAKRQEWEKIIASINLMMKNQPLIADTKTKDFLVQSLKNAHFNNGLALEKGGKYKEAAEKFLNYEKSFPGDASADTAVYNAAINYYKIGELNLATSSLEHLLQTYPQTKLKAESRLKLAESYEALTEYEKAALMYLAFAKENPQDARSDKAAYNAGVLSMGIEDYGLANTAFTYFSKQFSSSKLFDEMLTKNMETQIKLGSYKEALKIGNMALSRNKNKDSEVSLDLQADMAKITYDHIDQKKGLKDFLVIRQTLLKSKTLAPVARFTVAQFFLQQTDPEVKRFLVSNLTYEGIENKLQGKQKQLQRLADQLTQVIEIGSAEQVVASFYLLGEAHEHFADELFALQAPKGTNAKDVNDFKSATEKLAFPLKEDAQKFYEEAYKRSREVASFSAWTEKAYEKMATLDHGKYPQTHNLAASPNYMTHSLSTLGGNLNPVVD